MHPAAFHRALAEVVFDEDVPELSERRSDVVDFTVAQIASMPPHLRLGIDGVAHLLAARSGARPTPALASRWAQSRLQPIRQYLRLVRSFVLFGGGELAMAPTARVDAAP